MSIFHHPDDSTILAYTAGALNEGFSLVVAAHLQQCPHCRERLDVGDTLGGELLADLDEAAIDAKGLENIWARIESSSEPEAPSMPEMKDKTGEIPPMLADELGGGGLDSIAWRTLVPGVKQYRLDRLDSVNGSVRLLSIAPGVTIPNHTHGGNELTLVLRGSYTDEIGRFRAGDLADLDTTTFHQPVADTDEACICLIATDERLRFSGVFSRMLQPFVGI